MRIQIAASTAVFEEDKYSLIAGVQGNDGNEHYLTLSRDAEGNFEDWGVHIEFDDQLYSDYGLVSQCRVRRAGMSVDLGEPIEKMPDVLGFDVAWSLSSEKFEEFVSGLRRVFRDTAILVIE